LKGESTEKAKPNQQINNPKIETKKLKKKNYTKNETE